jgi:hypothetical protein
MQQLTEQQSTRIAELPDDYRVVGVDRGAPLVRKPTGQVLRIQQNGRLVAATTEAKCRLAVRADERDRLAASWAATRYTGVCG